MGIDSDKPSTTIINKLRQYYFRFDLREERKYLLRFYLLSDCSTDINYWYRQPLKNRNNELGAIDKFIDSKNLRLMLMLGDAGSGKSALTQWLVNYFCEKGNDKTYPSFVPIRIELKAYSLQSVKDAIEQALKTQFHLNAQEIEELRQTPDVVFLLDGYDEIAGRIKLDIYRENKCHEKWQNAKVIITCRNAHFKDEAECKEIFHIAAYEYDNQSLNTNYADLLYIAPFDDNQIGCYLDQFVKSPANFSLTTSDISHAKSLIKQHENLKIVIQNPFVLQIFAETFPNLKKKYGSDDINKIVMSDIYEQFLEDWFTHAKRRLEESATYDNFEEKIEDVKECFYDYAKAFAYALFAEDKVEITYTPTNSNNKFTNRKYTGHKAFEHFFRSSDPNSESQKQLDVQIAACPLRRKIKDKEDVYSFIHKSFQDYLAAKYLFELLIDRYEDVKDKDNKTTLKDIMNRPEHSYHHELLEVLDAWNKRYVTEDRLVLRFLAESLEKLSFEEREAVSEELLLPMIQYSAKDKSYAKAASSIISTINAAKVTMSGWDLREVSIQKADLSRAILHRTLFNGANLEEVKFNQAYMAESILSHSQMKDVEFGELPYLKFENYVNCLNYSPDGKKMAVGQGNVIIIAADPKEKQIDLVGHSGEVRSIAFSYVRTILASGSNDCSIRLWDVKSGKELRMLQGHSSYVKALAFSSDDAMLASGSDDNSVRIWDDRNGNCLHILQEHSEGVRSLAFSPDNTMLASGSGDTNIRLWNARNGKVLKMLQGHNGVVACLAFNADGNTLISGSWDNSIRLWDLKTREDFQVLQGHMISVSSIALNNKDNLLAAGSWNCGGVCLWDIVSRKELQVLIGHFYLVSSVTFNPKDSRLATGSWDKTVRIWDIKSCQELKVLQGDINKIHSIVFSADGSTLASGNHDKNIKLCYSKNGEVLRVLQGHSDYVASVAISPDGRLLASGSYDKSVQLWDIKSGGKLRMLTGHQESVNSVAFSPDGRLLASGSHDKSVRLWDIQSGYGLQVLQGHQEIVNSVAFSPDGRLLASGSHDKSVRLWDIQSGYELQVLQGHQESVKSVAFSPDGRLLASGSFDKTIRIWNLLSFECSAVIANGSPVNSVTFNKQNQLISGDEMLNSAVRLWQLQNNQWHLKWSIPQQLLYMEGCIIEGVNGLSDINRQLIEQRSSEIQLLTTKPTKIQPIIIDAMRDPLSVPINENPSTENDKKDKLVELLFNGILKKLAEKNLKALSPKIFLVYAHDNTKYPEKLADSEIAKLLITWLQKDLKLNLYSDITPFGNQESSKTVNDIQRRTDILKSQLCLLPKTEDSVDTIVLCGSELLKSYCDLKKYEDYYTALNNALSRGKPGAEYANVQGIVNQYSKEQDFHHVLTELVFLNKRILDEGQQTVIPVMLNCKNFPEAFPHFISGTDVYIEKTKYREHKIWNNKEVYKNEGLYLGFFDLLERLFEGKEIQKEITFFKDQFINKVELIRRNKLAKDKIDAMYRELMNEIEEAENEQLGELDDLLSFGLSKIKESRLKLVPKESPKEISAVPPNLVSSSPVESIKQTEPNTVNTSAITQVEGLDLQSGTFSPQNTAGFGDCAFHAIFGKWNGEQFVCDDVADKRKQLADCIRNSKTDITLFNLVKEAIKALIIENKSTKSLNITKAQHDYKTFASKDLAQIDLAWNKFEKILQKSPHIIEHINHFCKEYFAKKSKLLPSSIKDKFQTCFNEEGDGLLKDMILSMPELGTAFIKYNDECAAEFNWEAIYANSELINEYATFIETMGNWLMAVEIQIVAHVFTTTIDYHVKNSIKPNSNLQKVDTFNPGKQHVVSICFNGLNHYEKMASHNELMLSDALLLPVHQTQSAANLTMAEMEEQSPVKSSSSKSYLTAMQSQKIDKKRLHTAQEKQTAAEKDSAVKKSKPLDKSSHVLGRTVVGIPDDDLLKSEEAQDISAIEDITKSEIDMSGAWNLPAGEHETFIERADLEEEVNKFLTNNKYNLSIRPLVLCCCIGLQGLGKTTFVINYAYKNYNKKYNRILWFCADSEDSLSENYIKLGLEQKLIVYHADNSKEKKAETSKSCSGYYSNDKKLLEKDIINIIKDWLEKNPGWLLIYDNAESYGFLKDYLPKHGGHVLVTSIDATIWKNSVAFSKFSPKQSKEYVKRVIVITNNEQDADIDKLIGKQYLDHLPLALAHACYYIKNSDNVGTIKQYLEKFDIEQKDLLSHKDENVEHESVRITWKITKEEIEEKCPVAAKLLKFCSFIHPDNIDHDLLNQYLILNRVTDKKEQENIRKLLYRYSMITVNKTKTGVLIHRLVQRVICDDMNKNEVNTEFLPTIIKILASRCTYQRDNIKNIQIMMSHFKYLCEKTEHINRISIENIIFTEDLAKIFYHIGLYYQDERKDYKQAIENFVKARFISNKPDTNKELNFKILRQLAKAYTFNKQIDNAEREHQSLQEIIKSMLKGSLSDSLEYEIERVEIDYSHLLEKKGEYEISITILEEIKQNSKYKKNQAWACHLLGNSYSRKAKLLKENANYKRSLQSKIDTEVELKQSRLKKPIYLSFDGQESISDSICAKGSKIEKLNEEIISLEKEIELCLNKAYGAYRLSIKFKIDLCDFDDELINSATGLVRVTVETPFSDKSDDLIYTICCDIFISMLKDKFEENYLHAKRIKLLQNMPGFYNKYKINILKNIKLALSLKAYFVNELKYINTIKNTDPKLINDITQAICNIAVELNKIKLAAQQSSQVSEPRRLVKSDVAVGTLFSKRKLSPVAEISVEEKQAKVAELTRRAEEIKTMPSFKRKKDPEPEQKSESQTMNRSATK